MAKVTVEKEGKKVDVNCCPPKKQWHHHRGGGAWGFAYFTAFIGVAVYYVQQVTGFWPTILALLKAIVWPAFLLYHVFSNLHL